MPGYFRFVLSDPYRQSILRESQATEPLKRAEDEKQEINAQARAFNRCIAGVTQNTIRLSISGRLYVLPLRGHG
jgi:hypothetical protein